MTPYSSGDPTHQGTPPSEPTVHPYKGLRINAEIPVDVGRPDRFSEGRIYSLTDPLSILGMTCIKV